MIANPNIIDVTTQNFDQAVMMDSQTTPVLLHFWAKFSEPSTQLTPILEAAANQFNGGFTLAKVDIEAHPSIAQQVGLQSLPTVILVKDGQMLDHFMTEKNAAEVHEFLAKHIQFGLSPLEQADEHIAKQEFDEALTVLQAAWNDDVMNGKYVAKILDVLLQTERLTEAHALVAGIKEELKLDPAVQAVMAQLELTEQAADLPELLELEAKHQANPSSKSAHELAIAYNQAKRYEQAFELLIGVMQSDRAYTEVRPTLLDMFNTVKDAALVTTYRRKMYTLMY